MASALTRLLFWVALIRARVATALVLRDDPSEHDGDCTHGEYIRKHQTGLFGSPHVVRFDQAKEPCPYTRTPWREHLGERLLNATKTDELIQSCNSYVAFGPYVWCGKAMPPPQKHILQQLSQWHACQNDLPGAVSAGEEGTQLLREESLETTDANGFLEALPAQDFLGLSFGVGTYDDWSAMLSSLYRVQTRLHDCHRKTGVMKHDIQHGNCSSRQCYNVLYETSDVCLGNPQDSHKSKTFKQIDEMLKGRSKLSTFVKLDLKGDEWDVLPTLLAKDEDAAKIRTLDIHFDFSRGKKFPRNFQEEHLTARVKLVEMLLKKFAVVGSDVQSKHEDLFDRLDSGDMFTEMFRNAHRIKEPRLHTTNGFSMERFSLSFVNRALLV